MLRNQVTVTNCLEQPRADDVVYYSFKQAWTSVSAAFGFCSHFESTKHVFTFL